MNRINQLIFALVVVATLTIATILPVSAHNAGIVNTGDGECVIVGESNNPPVGNDGQPRGLDQASDVDESAVIHHVGGEDCSHPPRR